MKRFTRLSAKVMPLALNDVDTDMLIPAQFLTSISKQGYGKNLFRRLREADPQFPLNQACYADAQILVANDNFGCGSSREHAVWALMDAGFVVVVAKSFADIFAGNAAKNGLLLITLPGSVVDDLRERAVGGALTLDVDLENVSLRTPEGVAYAFTYDPFRRHCLLEGLDDLDYLLNHVEDIRRFKAAQTHRIQTTEVVKL